MSNKPIIEIDVSDEKFREFYAIFKAYAADLEDMPEDWKKMARETGSLGASMSDVAKLSSGAREQMMLMAIQADAIGKAFDGALETHSRLTSALRTSNEEMSKMVAASKKLSDGAFGAIGHVAGGNGVAGIETAISTLGGLMGPLGKVAAIIGGIGTATMVAAKKLADDAVYDQRDARGLGVSTGELRSFDLNTGRYVDSSMLDRTADAKYDLSGLPMLARAAGVSLPQAQSMDAAQLAMKSLQREHEWAKNASPETFNQQYFHAMGFDVNSNFREALRLRAMTGGEWDQTQAHFAKDINPFNVTDTAVNALNDLSRGVDERTMHAKAGLQEGAGQGIKALEDLFSGKAPAGAAKALDDLGISADKLSRIFDGLDADIKKWFGMGGDDKPGTNGQPGSSSPSSASGAPQTGNLFNQSHIVLDPNWTVAGEAHRLAQGAVTLGKYFMGAVSTPAHAAALGVEDPKKLASHAAAINGDDPRPGNAADAIAYFMKHGNLTRAQAAGIAAGDMVESGLHANILGDDGTAYGAGQWHAKRQAEFKKLFGHDIKGSSLREQYDFQLWELTHGELAAGRTLNQQTSAAGAGAVMSGLYERPRAILKEEFKRALLADSYDRGDYNMTPADAERLAIHRFGNQYNFNMQTKGMSGQQQRAATQQVIKVVVENSTSARVAVSTNAAAVAS
ncbi:phage tail tip lysozyme [Paraburkholderia adhaesiva]|uniref:phage tail tip lysozyme n=1 Tax=Paraburkholderia adhaesiva TaxID=2883244 RepID=UPI001F1E137C|nr:phage tail tip lysozyme [Paraburkholderia adhaesiva]